MAVFILILTSSPFVIIPEARLTLHLNKRYLITAEFVTVIFFNVRFNKVFPFKPRSLK